jgi:CRISPR-associated protein Cas2
VRNQYLATYDIAGDKRLRRVFRCLNGYGDPIQYSVFFRDLSPQEPVLLLADLTEIIHQQEDEMLIVNLGLIDGRGSEVVESLRRKLRPTERGSVVV